MVNAIDTGIFEKKKDYDAKINEIKGKIPSITAANELNDVEKKIPSVSTLVKKADYDTKISKLRKNILQLLII